MAGRLLVCFVFPLAGNCGCACALIFSVARVVDVCVPRDQKKKLDFSKEAKSVLFMLRNKNTYPLQENKGRRKKKNLMRIDLHL